MRIGTLKLVYVAYMHVITLLGIVCKAFQQTVKYVSSKGKIVRIVEGLGMDGGY
jgi:hypothetical protein